MAENDLVHMKLIDTSDCNFRYHLENVPTDLSSVTGNLTIAPRHLLLRFTPVEGRWHLDLISVLGPPVVDGKVKERKRYTTILFMADQEQKVPDELPDWLREIAEHHVHLMNPEALHERQQEAAREAAREMFSLASEDMADEMADKIFTAIRRVG